MTDASSIAGWHDISIPLAAGTPSWPGDTAYECRWGMEISAGASVNVSSMHTSPHVGTHADAPLHVRSGAPAADAIPLIPFNGPAIAVDVRSVEGPITMAILEQSGLHGPVERLLVRTDRTVATGSFPVRWPALTADCAKELVARGLKLLAVDCPSVDDRDSKSLEVHHAVFDGGAWVLENLDLRGVSAGRVELRALPMAMGAVDAAPVRALLR